MRTIPIAAVAALAVCATLLAGCGEVTDVSAGVDDLNTELQARGAQVDCPEEVDGGAGTTFDCTMRRRTSGGPTAPVTLKVVEERGQLAVDLADEKQFDAALKKVAD